MTPLNPPINDFLQSLAMNFNPPNLKSISPYLLYQSTEKDGWALHLDGVQLSTLVEQYGSPLFVYSKNHIVDRLRLYTQGFGHRKHGVYYSVKVNSNLHVLKVLDSLGAKFDVVSKGELQRVMCAGAAASDCVFAGVGKTQDELLFALQNGIGCINVESRSELERLNCIAQSIDKIAPISLRINPNIDAKTHPYISTGLHENKFGIVTAEAYELYQWAHVQSHLKIRGISCHIGSQLLDLSPLLQAAEKVVDFARSLEACGFNIEHLNFGGGIGINYDSNDDDKITSAVWQDYFDGMSKIVPSHMAIHIEPGRSIIGNGGVLLTQVQYLKQQGKHSFAIVDAAMNDIIRPALYNAYHQIVELDFNPQKEDQKKLYNVVGPVCESADCLARDVLLSADEGDCLAILSAGAYCFCMSSNYNSRPKVAEIMVDGGDIALIRSRETFEQMIEAELLAQR